MRLKNKKTGGIATLTMSNNGESLLLMEDGKMLAYNVKLSDLEEWEDYEEPKEYWYIYGNQVLKNECDGVMEDWFKEIGNYFETKEEALATVEKLKAIKRLKDKGFRFVMCDDRVEGGKLFIVAKMPVLEIKESQDDLDLLFGGEDE